MDSTAYTNACNRLYLMESALRIIAMHYNECDLSDDASSRFVVRTACNALGWTVTTNSDGEVIVTQ